MWIANLILCCAIGFGCFIYAIMVMMRVEDKKRGADKAP